MATHAVESALETSVPARRRRVLPIILATTATLALGAFAFAKWRFARVHVTTDNAQVDGHITVISPRVQAFVSQVRVDDNQRVNEGDTLVVLDDRDLRVREDQAKADLASAIAAAGSNTRGGQAQAQLAWSEAQASSAQANVASAEAAARKAAADLERMKVLAQERIVPPQQLDESEAAADAAKANLTAAQKQASAAQSQVSAYGAAVTGATARLESAQVSARQRAAPAELYRHHSPYWRESWPRRSVEPGALVSVGQGLMQLIPESDVWVTANLKETQVRDVNPGDKATFTVDAYPGRTFYGHVESLSPATGARFSLLPPDNATGNFTKVVQRVPVRISVDSGAGPGASASPRHVGRGHDSDQVVAMATLALPARPARLSREEVYRHRYLIAFAVVSASVLELVDTSIVNVAIPHMMGNLGATLDEIAWVSTGYIVANVIILPLTSWLSDRFGRRNYYTGSIILFTLASFLAGNAHTLEELIAARVIQGIGGGALISTAQAILFDVFPLKERGKAMAIFGMGVMVGPTLGPTLGGWITDNYSWPWIFYINIPLGILAAMMIVAVCAGAGTRQRAGRSRGLAWPGAADRRNRLPAGAARTGRVQGMVRLRRNPD